MVAIVLALIGVAGTFAAGSAFSDWLKRRNLHESIRSDIEIWRALPDESDAKHSLLERIEHRVDAVAVPSDTPNWWRSLAFFLPSLLTGTVLYAVLWINLGVSLRRDDNGVLRLYSLSVEKAGETPVAFAYAVMIFAVTMISAPLVGLVISKVVRYLLDKAFPTRTAAPKPADTRESDQTPATPLGDGGTEYLG